jgi:hypothetical protein
MNEGLLNMNNIKLGDYKSFLHFVKERITDLNDLELQIVKGEQFSVTKVFNEFIIDTVSALDPSIDLMTTQYFENKINQNIYWFVRNYNEFFVLLHEIGHIVTRNLYNMNELQQEYNFLNSNKYNSVYEAYTANRELPIETLADNFAIEFTNKYYYDIVNYFTGMSKEDADSFTGILN